tara:strand:+ start:945 stop:1334 length:390 start_codon:yes stop_codon:yes gene_type:complete
MTSLDDSDNESVDSETSETWNWRNAENNRLIIQLYKYDKEQDRRLDKLEQRLNGIMALLGINEVPENNVGLDGFDQLIPDDDILNNQDNQRPEGGGKRRRKRKTKKKRKKKRKKTRRKKKRKGRKTRRK